MSLEKDIGLIDTKKRIKYFVKNKQKKACMHMCVSY